MLSTELIAEVMSTVVAIRADSILRNYHNEELEDLYDKLFTLLRTLQDPPRLEPARVIPIKEFAPTFY